MKVNLSSDQLPLNKCVFFKGLIISKFSNEPHGLDMAKKNVWLKVLLVLVSLILSFCFLLSLISLISHIKWKSNFIGGRMGW